MRVIFYYKKCLIYLLLAGVPGGAQYIQSDVFITVKDHKESVPGRIDCRLINPAKSNIGRISKQIISEAVLSIKNKTRSNQWINTSQVIDWLKNLENKV